MTFYVENETDTEFAFPAEAVVGQVMEEILSSESCPYDAQVNVLLTDNEGIRTYNRTYRGMDRPTDVLSCPNLDFDSPADFSMLEEHAADYFDMESGELLLGDIIISLDKVREQAEKYNHGLKREYAFLIAHSMLHLLGYDHMTEADAAAMEAKQSAVLDHLGIYR